MENTICENQPYLTNDHIASSITSVLDAKEECQRLGSACGGFFDSLGNGNSFIICGAPVLLITSSSVLGSVLYRVEGNKELLCLYFISRIIYTFNLESVASQFRTPLKFLGYDDAIFLNSTIPTIAGATWELTDDWDCQDGQQETKSAIPWGSEGAIEGRHFCATKCLNTKVSCVSFSYPKEADFCVLRHNVKKSRVRGWDCGGQNSKWQYYTLLTRYGKFQADCYI